MKCAVWTRRHWLVGLVLVAPAGCAAAPVAPWEGRLQGSAVVLLGEVHDNAEQHRLRLAVLRRALHAGWRPAIAMEQFDADRQAEIDRARRERPGDARYLIEQASAGRRGWEWAHYRPIVALALEFELPLLAANLPPSEAARLVRSDYAEVLGEARARELGLVPPPSADWQAEQQRAVDAGHCGRLPAELLGGMARAQFARDAVMADTLRRHGPQGTVLLAGNGHVRRDLGVPRWLNDLPPERLWAVGFVESPTTDTLAGAFDAVVVTAAAERDSDLCDKVKAPPR